jgi:pimeloyl-ACP methyl ester carboxylesterase
MIFLGATFKGIQGQQHLETAFEASLEPLLRMVDRMPRLAKPLIGSLQTILLAPKTHPSSVAVHGPSARKQTSEMLSFVHGSLQALVIEPFATEQSVINYAKQLVTFWERDVTSLLGKIGVPVLFLGGECDQIASPQLARVACRLIPGAKYLEIKGGSHYLQYEKYELVTDIINHFLKEKWNFTFDDLSVTVDSDSSPSHFLTQRLAAPGIPYVDASI